MSFSDILCQRFEVSDGNLAPISSQTPATTISSFAAADSHYSALHHHDWERTLHVAITGLVWTGPLGHSWYAALESVVRVRHRVFGIALRMLLDAMIYSPIAVAGYFVWRSILEGSDVEGTRAKLDDKFTDTVFASWKFWPIANIINFSFVAVPYRVLYSSSLSLLWTGYLSFVNGVPKQSISEARLVGRGHDCHQTIESSCIR